MLRIKATARYVQSAPNRRCNPKVGILAAALIAALAIMAAAAPARAGTYSVVYQFTRARGGGPVATLLDVGQTLYGTTEYGGTSRAGTVFSLTSAGEAILYSFKNSTDGSVPEAALIDVGGKLYGTTSLGGNDYGTIFSLDPATRVESALYAFQGAPDGSTPLASLIDVNGVLYGTTSAGGAGACQCGTVFSFNLATGAKTTVYSFLGGTDGASPHAGLLSVGGMLYGTTQDGGNENCSGCGTVFAVDPVTGAEKVVYAFRGNNDGAYPLAALIAVGSTLYGTTYAGGDCEMTGGCGTVFALNPATGAEHVVHTFVFGNDGEFPTAAVIDLHGILYGTTESGGLHTCEFYGCGTVFALNPTTGAENLPHIFQAGSDGAEPQAGLINVNGTLFGATPGNGINGCTQDDGCGTLFTYKP